MQLLRVAVLATVLSGNGFAQPATSPTTKAAGIFEVEVLPDPALDALVKASRANLARCQSLDATLRGRTTPPSGPGIRIDVDSRTNFLRVLDGQTPRSRIRCTIEQSLDGVTPKPGNVQMIPPLRVFESTIAEGVNLTYEPMHKRAILRPVAHPEKALIPQVHIDPLFYGANVRGVSVDDLLKGRSIELTDPESHRRPTRRTLRLKERGAGSGGDEVIVESVVQWTRNDGVTKATARRELRFESRSGALIGIKGYFSLGDAAELLSEDVQIRLQDFNGGRVASEVVEKFSDGGPEPETTTVNIALRVPEAKAETRLVIPAGTRFTDEINHVEYTYPGGDAAKTRAGIEASIERAQGLLRTGE